VSLEDLLSLLRSDTIRLKADYDASVGAARFLVDIGKPVYDCLMAHQWDVFMLVRSNDAAVCFDAEGHKQHQIQSERMGEPYTMCSECERIRQP
jgi:hypothetical protein